MNNPFELIESRLTSIENLILDFRNQTKIAEPLTPPEQSDQWLGLDDLIKYDPAKRTKGTWYGIVSRGEVPYHKNGKHLVFLKSEIDEWLMAGKRKSNSEIEAEAEAYLLNKKRLV